MIREPAELHVDEAGRVELPLGILAEAGISPGTKLLVFSDGDGRIVLRRAEDAINDLLAEGTL
ncbi:AbrB/MazE/SpoVT family DNA-binding domain-containing protein [Streptomyces lavendulocolor]